MQEKDKRSNIIFDGRTTDGHIDIENIRTGEVIKGHGVGQEGKVIVELIPSTGGGPDLYRIFKKNESYIKDVWEQEIVPVSEVRIRIKPRTHW